MTRSVSARLLSLAVVCLAGCAGLGPTAGDTTPPNVNPAWSAALAYQLPAADDTVPPLRERISDPQLATLVTTALTANVDTQIARERIVEARALAGLDQAELRLQLAVDAGVTDQRLSENGVLPAGRIPGFEPNQTLYEAGFDASWELDLFGRRGAVRDRAALRVALQETELADTEASLVAEIVRRYVEYNQYAAELALLDIVVQKQRALFDATVQRRDHGEASDYDVALAKAELAAAQTRVPGVRRAQRIAHHRLAVLTGQAPAALTIEPAPPGTAPWSQAMVIDATPSSILRRRPDVRVAEIRYAQSVRDSDLARLDFYPKVTLFAAAGPEATSRGDLTDSASLASAIGALFEWAVLDGGRRQANLDATESREAQSALAYRRSVLSALEELENAAVLVTEAESQYEVQAKLLSTREQLADAARRRFEGGTVSLLTILESERDLADARIEANRAHAKRHTEVLALEKALGSI
ncbi:MAG: efflux transporter outer membrane subunit [Pseudomonadota bacterium]